MMLILQSVIENLNVVNSLCVVLTTIVGMLTIFHFWFQSLPSTKLGNKLPGIDPIPLIGNAHLAFNKRPEDLLKWVLEIYKDIHGGPVIRVWFGTRLGVLLNDSRDVELILGSQTHLEKCVEYDFFQPWLGDGLLISKGEKWRFHRKMIAPTFHQSILKSFLPVFNKNADELVSELRKNGLNQIIDVHDNMSGATVDVLLETVMDVKKTKEARSSLEYAKAVMKMCKIIHVRQYRLWLRPDIIFRFTKMFQKQKSYVKTIHSFTDNVIKKKKLKYFERLQSGHDSLYKVAVKETEEPDVNMNEEQKESGIRYGSGVRDDLDENDENLGEKKRLAFLDFMIEASQTQDNKFSDLDIRDEVNTIMFEGHDTTASASSFFLCLLGVYEEIQEKVYQELKEIFQNTNRPITFNDTLEMKYLERTLLETLRLYPPVPMIGRVLREDVKLASADYVIPAGTTIGISQYLIHRNPEVYPNPEKFDPDNFLPERCQQRNYYSFIPFSAGPRSCVGRKYAMLKMKILLANIVRNFKITSPVSEKDFELQGDIILKRADGFRVILEDRINN